MIGMNYEIVDCWWEAEDQDGNLFGTGVWRLKFDVEDNNGTKADCFEAKHRLWHSGSMVQMWKVMWGGPTIKSDNEVLNYFGILEPIITMSGFISAAIAAKCGPKGRIIARGIGLVTTVLAGAHKVLGLASFLTNDNPGAILGLAFNLLFSSLMYIIVDQITRIIGEVQHLLNSVNINKLKSLTIRDAMGSKFDLFYKVLKVLAALNIALQFICNPQMAIPAALIFILLSFFGGAANGKEKTFFLAILPIAMTLGAIFAPNFGMDQFFSSLPETFTNLLDMMGSIGNIPMEISGFFLESLGLGFLLSITGKLKDKQVTTVNIFGQSTSTSRITYFDSTSKYVKIYNVLSLFMMSVCFGVFFERTGFQDASLGLFFNTEQYGNNADTTASYGGIL